MSILTTLRLEAVKALGGKCAKCGFDKDLRVLFIMVGDEEREEVKKHNRYSVYLQAFKGAQEGKCSLLCANCKFGAMYDKRGMSKEVDQARVMAWKTNLDIGEALGEVGWLQEKVKKGWRVVVVERDDGSAWEYKSKEFLGRWEDVAKKNGWQVEFGNKVSMVVSGEEDEN